MLLLWTEDTGTDRLDAVVTAGISAVTVVCKRTVVVSLLRIAEVLVLTADTASEIVLKNVTVEVLALTSEARAETVLSTVGAKTVVVSLIKVVEVLVLNAGFPSESVLGIMVVSLARVVEMLVWTVEVTSATVLDTVVVLLTRVVELLGAARAGIVLNTVTVEVLLENFGTAAVTVRTSVKIWVSAEDKVTLTAKPVGAGTTVV